MRRELSKDIKEAGHVDTVGKEPKTVSTGDYFYIGADMTESQRCFTVIYKRLITTMGESITACTTATLDFVGSSMAT